MGIWDALRGLFAGKGKDGTLTFEELARRLGLGADELRAVRATYTEFEVAKRSGGTRPIAEPSRPLKRVQRLVLRRLLGKLRAHPAAHGFERGRSIVTNARLHAGKRVVLRLDLEDFFGSIKAGRVETYFRRVGWDGEAASLLARICTHRGSLPQGAPTSPRLSNLVNFRLDSRLAALARRFGADYTRYADDLTFSFAEDSSAAYRVVLSAVRKIVAEEGYRLHTRKKLRVSRRHRRQTVTGLVVNVRASLPRETRRWLRAVEHRARTGRETTLTPAQLAGWRALRAMVDYPPGGRN
ncbi:MAG TPA: reverse transcriptase family protein [Pyrinomonadaceae bacterium]|nr:reverse transcriptase family protein [Pyrinomonadaceae bacterium]